MISFTVTCLARAIGGNQATVRSYVTVAKIPGSPTVVAGGGTGDIARLRVGWPSNPKRRRFHCTRSPLCRYKGAIQKGAPSAPQRLLRHRPLTLACCAGLPPSAALSPQAGRGEKRPTPHAPRPMRGAKRHFRPPAQMPYEERRK